MNLDWSHQHPTRHNPETADFDRELEPEKNPRYSGGAIVELQDSRGSLYRVPKAFVQYCKALIVSSKQICWLSVMNKNKCLWLSVHLSTLCSENTVHCSHADILMCIVLNHRSEWCLASTHFYMNFFTSLKLNDMNSIHMILYRLSETHTA